MGRLELLHGSEVSPTYWTVSSTGSKVGLRGKTAYWVSLVPVHGMA